MYRSSLVQNPFVETTNLISKITQNEDYYVDPFTLEMIKSSWMAFIDFLKTSKMVLVGDGSIFGPFPGIQQFIETPSELKKPIYINIYLWLIATYILCNKIDIGFISNTLITEVMKIKENNTVASINKLIKMIDDPRALWILKRWFAPKASIHLIDTISSLQNAERRGTRLIDEEYYKILGREIFLKADEVSIEALKNWDKEQFNKFITYSKEQNMTIEAINAVVELFKLCTIHYVYYIKGLEKCPLCDAGIQSKSDLHDLKYEEGEGDSFIQAYNAASRKLPPGKNIQTTLDFIKYGQKGVDTLLAMSKDEVENIWKTASPDRIINYIACLIKPKKGLLGMGRKVGEWSVHWKIPYIVRIYY